MLYDTICEIWPQYRSHPRRVVEQRFVERYPVTMRYRWLLALTREGPDPLGLMKEAFSRVEVKEFFHSP